MATTLKSATQGEGPLSSNRALRILIVDDTPADVELIVARLKRAGYNIVYDLVALPERFQAQLRRSDYDLVISDHNLGSWTGMTALEMLHETEKQIPFIVVTGTLGDEAAVEYIKKGAADYVLKHRLELLAPAVGQALREKAYRDEEKRLQERILAGKREWELTFDSVPDSVLLIDDACVVQRANRAAGEMFGLSFSELVGRPCYEVLHGLAAPPADCPHAKLSNSGVPQRCDFEETRLGKTFDVTSTPIRGAEGTFRGCIHVLRDVTDRKRVDMELRHSLERYGSLISATSQVVWSADATGALIPDSPTLREFTGMSEEETAGQGWLAAVHPDDRERVAELWANAVKTACHYTAEFKARRKDGKYRDLFVRGVAVLDNGGAIREWVGTCADITEQRQLEEQFRQAQKMEAMGRLAGGVAHDFNNIMGVIIGYSDLLLASAHTNASSRIKLEEIRKAGYRAAALTRQMLAFSRKQVLTLKVLDLSTVVRETSGLLLRLLGEDVELITNLSPDLGHVKADPTQIDQVIMNLAINARDAMPTGGKLFIETCNAELDDGYGQQHDVEIKPGSYVVLKVSDTGIGMDKKTQSHLFEPFFTTKEIGKGTGLGLATVFGIIKQSGGYIWVYSELGKGSSFKIFLPRVQESLSHIKMDTMLPLRRGSETILLVEDEDALREIGRQLLESMGYNVVQAPNGAEAIRVSSQFQGRIDLLITDAIMPGISGRELADLLVGVRSEMKVLYVSGHTDDAIVHYSILKPGVAFLQKPFSREALARKIQEVLEA